MKKSKKLLTLGLLILVLTLGITGLTVVRAEGVKVQVQTPPTMAALPLLWLEENNLPEGVELKVNLSPDHSRALALLAKNELDLMITGENVGAKAFNKGIDIVHLNTNTWAVDYLLTGGFKAGGWADLKGKTLCLPLKGGPLDFLARYFLEKNGVDLEKAKLVYQPLANGARTFQLGKLDAIILPEPLVTVTLARREDAFLALDLQKEWARFHQGDERIPYVGLFASGKFARENSQLTALLSDYYRQGVDWVNAHPDEAAALGAKYFGMPAPVLKKAFTRINLSIYPREEAIRLLEGYYGEILKKYPEMLGGKIPDESFYF